LSQSLINRIEAQLFFQKLATMHCSPPLVLE